VTTMNLSRFLFSEVTIGAFVASTIGALIAVVPCVLILRRLGFSAAWAVVLLILVALSPAIPWLITALVAPSPAIAKILPFNIGVNVAVLKLMEWLPFLLLLWYFALSSWPKAAS